MSQSEHAVRLFGEGMNCAQAVLSAFASELGLDLPTALRLGTALGGGMGGSGRTCGALTGGMLVLGLKAGGTGKAREKTYELVRELVSRFEARHTSAQCRDLIGPIDTPETLQAAREKNIFRTVCPALVRDAAEIVQELIARQPASGH